MCLFKTVLIGCMLIGNVFACTTFCMDTPHGPVFGSNLDYFTTGAGLVFMNQRGIAKEGFQKGTTGKTIKWVSAYGSVTFNLAGREFAWGGMNEAGLVVGTMELLAGKFPEPDERPALTIGSWTQYVLDTCSSIDEVIALDKIVRIEDAPPQHYFVSDAQGSCVSIEFFGGKQHIRRGKELPVKAMSNSTYDGSLATFNKGGPRWWQRDVGKTRKRFAIAAERNRAYASNGEDDAIKYAFETLLTGDIFVAHTKWTVVYDIPQRKAYFRSAHSPTIKYLSLKDFNLSADAPLLMMDMNAPIEGPVKDAFVPFDYDTNLSVFRNLCAVNGKEISEDVANGLMRHFETFAPADVEKIPSAP